MTTQTDLDLPRKKKIRNVSDLLDVATTLAAAKNVIIVPGYVMAIAQAQYEIWRVYAQRRAVNPSMGALDSGSCFVLPNKVSGSSAPNPR